MPEGLRMNKAAHSVITERHRQVTEEGYSIHRDDVYVRNELAEAAAVYAVLAGKPGCSSSAWPWDKKTFKPSDDRRRDLVKAGALILAEIERLDRIQLIQPYPVQRDEEGMFAHPDLPNFDEDPDKSKLWLQEQGLEICSVSLETDAPEEIADRYFASDSPDCSYWEPSMPAGEGWFCLAIHDTEEGGPYCFWARREVTP